MMYEGAIVRLCRAGCLSAPGAGARGASAALVNALVSVPARE